MKMITSNLTKKYDRKIAVNNLSIEVPAHSLVAFLGHNGAGKSTTISMLIGILQPTSGKIEYFDDNGQGRKPKIGVVFQNSILDEELTVTENLILRAKMQNKESVKNIDKFSKLLGLTSFINERYGNLSGGQRRRVDIARALLDNPDFLFLDEPTTGLDIQTRSAIWKLLNNLRKEAGITIFLTTHYLEEAEDASLVYVVNHGKVIAKGSAQVIIAENTTNYLQIECTKRIDLTVDFQELGPNLYRIADVSVQDAIDFLHANQKTIKHFEYHKGTLNDAFMNLTGKELQ
ncbi:ABC transporter ATP-binding protein [Liquorilactobacillus hordei]|uniref:ABC transporter ATP-binding protein n=1 Tax=Liquorilactobacillus hordei TaxID=468911 RepID=A0A3S6QPT8_9LACO|nr:ABC transporter ATP-binding protein [Liquorilactobacillus hordei]AUJ29689.1 ABC transporter ATP-binding protein [Liquorilactobacillus hordei]